MTHAKLFIDMEHIKKNMLSTLGAEKTNGTFLNERAVRAQTKTTLDLLESDYGPKC